MAAPRFTATVDTTVTPIKLTVVCDFRSIEGDVHVLGQTVAFSGSAAVEVDDPDATWTLQSDDGVTSVYHLA